MRGQTTQGQNKAVRSTQVIDCGITGMLIPSNAHCFILSLYLYWLFRVERYLDKKKHG